jgi:peptidoglycan biosynthesis protein MviN/MurJ (putative lipid II flippase)
VPGLVLPFALTARLGAGETTDAYFYAFGVAIFVSSIVSLALEANVLVAAAHERRAGPSRLVRFARGLVARCVPATAAIYVVAGALALVAVAHWPSSELALCAQLTAIFGAYLCAIAASSVLNGCLYAGGAFFVPTMTIALRSLAPLAVLALDVSPRTLVLLVAVALAAGEAVRALVLAIALWRMTRAQPEPEVGAIGPAPAIWRTALPYAIAMIVFAANAVIDRAVAGRLAEGSVTVLDLAEKLFYAPVTILMSSVLLVSGARWAAMAQDDPEALSADFERSLSRAWRWGGALAAAMTVPVLAGLAVGPQRVAGVDRVTLCGLVAILLVGLPAAIATNAGVRLLTALRATGAFPPLAAAALVANAAADIAGAFLLGVQGIALASTAWRVLNVVLLLGVARRELRRRRETASPSRPCATAVPIVLPARLESTA